MEVVKFATDASNVASSGMELAASTSETFSELGSSSDEIGDVIRLIQNIADETNLLALNATIEAARAGEAGRGFAVVAAEVKELARQTAAATEQVDSRVSAIQAAAKHSIEAIQDIVEVIGSINTLQEGITEEIREQDAMTHTIHAKLGEAVAVIDNMSKAMDRPTA